MPNYSFERKEGIWNGKGDEMKGRNHIIIL